MDHHAVLYRANTLSDTDIPQAFHTQTADVLHITKDVLSISDARELIVDAYRLPLEGSMRVFVVMAREIAIEAQHALLKILEEPPKTTRFYFVLPKTARLLDTVRSRFFEVAVPSITDRTSEAWEDFLRAPLGEKMTQIAQMTKEKNTQWIEMLLRNTEAYAHTKKDKTLMEAVVFVRERLPIRGSSAKMLLEHLVLLLV
jgi:hypothetical protein